MVRSIDRAETGAKSLVFLDGGFPCLGLLAAELQASHPLASSFLPDDAVRREEKPGMLPDGRAV